MSPIDPVWETTTDAEWAEKQRQILTLFAQGGEFAKIMGRILDVKPPKSYAEILEEKRKKQRAAEIKAAAEAAIPVPTKKTGLETRQKPQVPIVGGPPTTRQAFEARPELKTPLKAFSLEELKATPKAIGETLALERGAPSWARKAYEETAAGVVAGGPTAFGFSPEALPLLEPLGYGLLRYGGRAGAALEAAPGRVTQALPKLAEQAAPAARRLATEEAGAVGPLGREARKVADIEAELANLRGLLKRGEGWRPGVQGRIAGLEEELAKAKGIPRVTPPEAAMTPAERLAANRAAKQGLQVEGIPEGEVSPIARKLAEAEFPETPITPAAGVGAGAEPPAGARPPLAGGEVPEDPVAKLTWLLKGAKKVQPEIEAVKHEERVARAAGLYGIYGTEGGEVAAKQAQASLRGELPRPSFQPVAESFTQTDRDALFNRIAQHYVDAGKPYNAVAPQNALWQILDQGRVPTMGEIARLQEVFGKELGAALRAKRTLGQKAWTEFLEWINVPRGIQAAFDLSYPLRQGIMAAPRHPPEWVRANKEMIAAAINEADATANLAKWEAKQAAGDIPQNLHLVKWQAGVEAAERSDVMASRFLNNIPLVRRSARAFAVAGNELRGGIAETAVNGWRRAGRKITTKDMEDLGEALNYLSGRGPVPKNLSQVLSAVLYAPRYLTSKPAFMVKMLSPSTSGAVRKLMAEEFVAFVSTGIGILTLAKLSGVADVELSPLSSDFGKVRVGKTRVDFWGGQQQLVRYAVQLIMGHRKTIGTGEFVDASRQAVAARFFISKLQPVAGVGAALMAGETYMGEPMEFTWDAAKREMWNRIAPMAIQDMVDAVRVQHAKGLFVAPGAFFGLGTQTYYTPGEKVQNLTKQYDPQGRGYNEMASVEFETLVAQHPDLAAARNEQVKAAAAWGSEWGKTKQAQQTKDTTYQTAFLDAWHNPQGRTKSDFSTDLSDYLRDRAVANQALYAGKDFDPRDELGRLLDEYWAIEPPVLATDVERQEAYARQDAMTLAHPELKEALRETQALHFPDPEMQGIVRQIWEARQVRKQLYNIPAFIGLTAQEGDQVNQIIAVADAMVQAGKAPARRVAIMQIASKYPQKLVLYALQAERLRNPERRMFRMQHQDELSWFEQLPVEEIDTLAMAGVK